MRQARILNSHCVDVDVRKLKKVLAIAYRLCIHDEKKIICKTLQERNIETTTIENQEYRQIIETSIIRDLMVHDLFQ